MVPCAKSPALCAFLSCITYLVLMTPAHAAMASVICQAVYLVQGDIGRGASSMGVMAVGAGAIMGKVSMNMAVTVAVGISILFSAQYIAAMIGMGGPC